MQAVPVEEVPLGAAGLEESGGEDLGGGGDEGGGEPRRWMMVSKKFRLVFEWTVVEETANTMPQIEDVRNIAEACCPQAMLEAIDDYLDTDCDRSPLEDEMELVSVELVEDAPSAAKLEACPKCGGTACGETLPPTCLGCASRQ